MTGDEIKKVLDIRVNYDKSVTRLGNYKEVLDQITAAEKQLKAELKAGMITEQQYAKQQQALTQNAKFYRDMQKATAKEILNTMRAEKEREGSLKQLRAQLSNVTKAYDELSKAEREGLKGGKLRAQINDITKALKDAEMQTQRFYRNVGNYQSAIAGLRQIGSGFKALGGIITSVIGGLSTAMLTRTFVDTVRAFEDGIARVRAVANPTIGELQQLTEKAKELGLTTRYTAAEVASGMEELSRKGFTAAETVESIQDVLQLAQSNSVSLADAAQVASATMRSFGMEASQMGKVVDVLSSSCSHSATTIESLGEAMKTAGPVARAANIPLEETTAMLGSLANIGMTGSDAGTGVKQVILALSTAFTTKKGSEVLHKYNIELDEARIRAEGLIPVLKEMKAAGLGESVTDLKQLAGKYAAPRLANLIASIDEIEALNKTLLDSFGENERMFNQSIGNMSTSIYMLRSAWEGFLIAFSESTTDYLTGPIDLLTGALRWLADNITLVGQTLTSVIAGMIAMPVWKGMLTLIGTVSNAWEVATAKARVSYDKLVGEAKIKTEELNVLQTKSAAINQQVLLEQQALQEMTTRKALLEQEKRQLIQNNASQKEILAVEKKIAAIIQAETAGNANLIALAQAKSDTVIAIGAAEKEALLAQQKVNAAMVAATSVQWKAMWKNLKGVASNTIGTMWFAVSNYVERLTYLFMRFFQFSSAQSQLASLRFQSILQRSHALSLARIESNWLGFYANLKAATTAFVTFTKTAFTTLITTLKGLLASFWPFLLVFAVTEIWGALKESVKIMEQLEDQFFKMRKRVDQHVAEDTRLQKMKALKETIDTINKAYQGGNKLTEDQNKTLDATLKRLNIQNDKLKTTEEKLKAINDDLDKRIEKEKEIAEVQAYQGIQQEAMTTLGKLRAKYNIAENLDPMFMQKAIESQTDSPFASWLYGLFGGDSVVKDAAAAAEAASNLKYANDWLSKNLHKEEETKTPPGDFKDTEGYSKEDKKDYTNQLLNLINTWTDKFKQLEVGNIVDEFTRQTAQINENYDKLVRDIEKLIGEGRDGKGGTLEKAFAKEPGLAKQLVAIMAQVEKEAGRKQKNDLFNINQSRQEAERKRTIENYDLGVKGFDKSANQESWDKYFLMMMNKLSVTEIDDAEKLKKLFATGKFGTPKDKGSGTYEDALKSYEEYQKQREELMQKYSDKDITKDEYDRQMAALDDQYKAEAEYYNRTILMQNIHQQESLKLEQDYQKQLQAIKEQAMQNDLDRTMLGYQNRLNALQDHYTDCEFASDDYWERMKGRIGEQQAVELQMQYQLADEKLQGIIAAGRQQGETQEAFDARVIAAEKAKADIHTKANEAIVESDKARWQAYHSIADGIIGLMETIGEEDENATKLAKVLALANIAISTGEAIAKMVSAESGKGIAGIATMAAGIGEILANIATAISTVRSAKFARGAVNINGAGTTTSDSIPAQISKGESVMNAKATKMFEPLLIAMNAIGNGVALPRNNYVQTRQTADMTEAFSEAVRNIRPVVDVQEITRTQNRVEVIQNLDSF